MRRSLRDVKSRLNAFVQTSRVLVTLLALAAGMPAAAQTTPPPAPPPETAPPQPAAAATPPAPAGPSRVHYGVRYGPSFTTLTSVEPFDETAVIAAFEPTLNFGGYVQIDMAGAFSFQPEVLFAAKGHRIRDKRRAAGLNADRRAEASAGGQSGAGALPRVPDADAAVEAHAREHVGVPHRRTVIRHAAQRRDSRSGRLGQARGHRRSRQRQRLSYIFGAGLQHRRWLVDARFTRGMRNIATDPTPVGVKTGAFSVLMGTRF